LYIINPVDLNEYIFKDIKNFMHYYELFKFN